MSFQSELGIVVPVAARPNCYQSGYKCISGLRLAASDSRFCRRRPGT